MYSNMCVSCMVSKHIQAKMTNFAVFSGKMRQLCHRTAPTCSVCPAANAASKPGVNLMRCATKCVNGSLMMMMMMMMMMCTASPQIACLPEDCHLHGVIKVTGVSICVTWKPMAWATGPLPFAPSHLAALQWGWSAPCPQSSCSKCNLFIAVYELSSQLKQN